VIFALNKLKGLICIVLFGKTQGADLGMFSIWKVFSDFKIKGQIVIFLIEKDRLVTP